MLAPRQYRTDAPVTIDKRTGKPLVADVRKPYATNVESATPMPDRAPRDYPGYRVWRPTITNPAKTSTSRYVADLSDRMHTSMPVAMTLRGWRVVAARNARLCETVTPVFTVHELMRWPGSLLDVAEQHVMKRLLDKLHEHVLGAFHRSPVGVYVDIQTDAARVDDYEAERDAMRMLADKERNHDQPQKVATREALRVHLVDENEDRSAVISSPQGHWDMLRNSRGRASIVDTRTIDEGVRVQLVVRVHNPSRIRATLQTADDARADRNHDPRIVDFMPASSDESDSDGDGDASTGTSDSDSGADSDSDSDFDVKPHQKPPQKVDVKVKPTAVAVVSDDDLLDSDNDMSGDSLDANNSPIASSLPTGTTPPSLPLAQAHTPPNPLSSPLPSLSESLSSLSSNFTTPPSLPLAQERTPPNPLSSPLRSPSESLSSLSSNFMTPPYVSPASGANANKSPETPMLPTKQGRFGLEVSPRRLVTTRASEERNQADRIALLTRVLSPAAGVDPPAYPPVHTIDVPEDAPSIDDAVDVLLSVPKSYKMAEIISAIRSIPAHTGRAPALPAILRELYNVRTGDMWSRAINTMDANRRTNYETFFNAVHNVKIIGLLNGLSYDTQKRDRQQVDVSFAAFIANYRPISSVFDAYDGAFQPETVRLDAQSATMQRTWDTEVYTKLSEDLRTLDPAAYIASLALTNIRYVTALNGLRDMFESALSSRPLGYESLFELLPGLLPDQSAKRARWRARYTVDGRVDWDESRKQATVIEQTQLMRWSALALGTADARRTTRTSASRTLADRVVATFGVKYTELPSMMARFDALRHSASTLYASGGITEALLSATLLQLRMVWAVAYGMLHASEDVPMPYGVATVDALAQVDRILVADADVASLTASLDLAELQTAVDRFFVSARQLFFCVAIATQMAAQTGYVSEVYKHLFPSDTSDIDVDRISQDSMANAPRFVVPVRAIIEAYAPIHNLSVELLSFLAMRTLNFDSADRTAARQSLLARTNGDELKIAIGRLLAFVTFPVVS